MHGSLRVEVRSNDEWHRHGEALGRNVVQCEQFARPRDESGVHLCEQDVHLDVGAEVGIGDAACAKRVEQAFTAAAKGLEGKGVSWQR